MADTDNTRGKGSGLLDVSFDKRKSTSRFEENEPDITDVKGCGVGPCQPSWMQPCADVRTFVAALAFANLNVGLVFACLISSLTTIEKRFRLTSAESGFILTAYEISHIPTTFLIGYFGSKAHAPRWMAISAFFMAVSMFIGVLPHLIFGEDEEFVFQFENVTSVFNNISSPDGTLCHMNSANTSGDECTDSQGTVDSNYVVYGLMVCLTIGMGIFTSPGIVLGVPYLDNNCEKHESAQYMGIIFSMYGVGPLIGFVVGASVLQIHVTLKETTLTPYDPRWIGAYWLLFLIGTILASLPGLILMFFPRVLRRKYQPVAPDGTVISGNTTENDLKNIGSVMSLGKQAINSVRGLPKATWRLLKKPILVTILLSWTFEMLVGSGYFIFMPKYVEEQFGQTSSFANVFAGVVGSGAGGLGMFLSGIMVSKFKFDRAKAAKVNFIITILTTCCLVALTFIGCDTGKVQSLVGNGDNQLCVSDCGCSSDQFSPVCGDDNMTYLSPCHAGCTSSSRDSLTFDDCACMSLTNGTSASQGLCPDAVVTCEGQTVAYSVFVFTSAFLNGLKSMCAMFILLRTVSPEDKPFALALQSTGASILASIPAPTMYGALVDSTCLLWQTTPCSEGKVCRAYDPDLLRYYLHGLSAAFNVLSLICFGYTWYACAKEDRQQTDEAEEETGDLNKKMADDCLIVESRETTC